MRTERVESIIKYIEKTKQNISNKPIPSQTPDGKRVSPPERKKIQDIKDAQIEVLNVIQNYAHMINNK